MSNTNDKISLVTNKRPEGKVTSEPLHKSFSIALSFKGQKKSLPLFSHFKN